MKTKFLLMRADMVTEIIPSEDPISPGVSITERYAPDFLSQCEEVTEDTDVQVGYIKTESGYAPAPAPEPTPEPAPFPPTPPSEPTYAERLVVMEEALLALMTGGV